MHVTEVTPNVNVSPRPYNRNTFHYYHARRLLHTYLKLSLHSCEVLFLSIPGVVYTPCETSLDLRGSKSVPVAINSNIYKYYNPSSPSIVLSSIVSIQHNIRLCILLNHVNDRIFVSISGSKIYDQALRKGSEESILG